MIVRSLWATYIVTSDQNPFGLLMSEPNKIRKWVVEKFDRISPGLLHIYHTKLKHYLLDKPHWPKMSIYTNLNNQSTFVSKLELSIILHIEENAYCPLKHFTDLLKTNTRHQILQASLVVESRVS